MHGTELNAEALTRLGWSVVRRGTFRDWSCGRWVVSGLVVSEGSLGRVWWMVTVSVDGLAGQHDTDTSEMIIRWMVGWFAGVSVAVGWSRSDGHGGNRSGSGTIYSVRWFGVVGVVGLEPLCATDAYVSPLLMGHSAGVFEFCSGLVDLVVRRTSPWRAWSSSHPCGRAIRGSGLRGRCGIFHLLSYGLRKFCFR